LSWIAVATCAIGYQCLECVYHAMEHGMIELLNEKTQHIMQSLENGDSAAPASTSSSYIHTRPRGWQMVKLTLAFVAALRYTLGLMLMLGMITKNYITQTLSSHHFIVAIVNMIITLIQFPPIITSLFNQL
jgi:hypothetical protein